LLTKVGILGILLLLPLGVLGQSVDQQITNEAELASILCRGQKDEQSRDALLRTYPQLIDGRLWEDITRRAAAAYYEESPERALKIYEVSIQVANKLNDPKLLAKTYYNLARTFSGVNQTQKAIQSYERSQQFFEQAGLRRDLIYVLADIGAIYFNKEDYPKAKEYSDKSILIADSAKSSGIPVGAYPDDFGRARALHTLAEMDLRSGDHEDAIEKLQRALALYQQLNGTSSNYNFYVAGVYAALGKVYPEIGEYAQALIYLSKALDIARVSNDQDTIANILNSIGFLYMEQEDYAQAREHFDRSLKIYLAENNQIEASRLFLNLGVIEQRQSHYDDALRQFTLSLQAAKATQIADVQIAAGEGVGVVLTAKMDFPRALAVLNESLALAKQTSNKTRQIELLWRTAQTFYDMGDYVQAAASAEDAVALARASHLPKLTYLATTTLGQSYAAQKKFDLAVKTLTQAVEQVEAMRDQVGGQELERQLFLETKVSSYNALIDVLVKQDKPLDALLYAERAKGRVLLDALRSGKADLTKAFTPAERENAQRLNRDISEINEQIRKAEMNRSASPISLYPRLDAARLEYQSFQDAVFVNHPALNVRGGRTTTIDRSGIDGLIRDRNSAYLEYVVSKDRVYLFVLSATKSTNEAHLKSYQLSVTPEELVRKVDQFHNELASLHPDYSDVARELYNSLVAPAAEQLKGIDTLCIVPDGFLWNLPFQALMPASERYLLEDHPIYYIPSLSVLREMSNGKRGVPNANSLIAFGNPVIGKDEQRQVDLCPLPEAENEVVSISKSPALKAKKVFIGREASEREFKALAPGFSVIHLATHGVLDNRNPLYSHLLLTKSEGDVQNDGLLEAREIMDMRLNADLAVLSACETANGKIAPGEGVMGMSWAFFVAGTRSMLVSQWKVNSSSTSQLMVDFYQQSDLVQNRRDGTNASALRAAALKLMKDDRYRHPFFWASFVLVGVNQPSELVR
jgi:CHAT domain-containing protein